MLRFELTRNELERLKRAAELTGFPWQAIAERPKTARRFIRRIEAGSARTLSGEPTVTRQGGPARLLRQLVAA